ncbi:MAG: RNA polymerase sigma factor RpoH [Pseudomonadota bacterium]|nr:RNA polymerase sigma factor RpoH [Pseudomonadota bacterium]
MSELSLPMPVLAGASSIESYIQAVNRLPLLSHEEEIDLGRRLREDNELEAARQMVMSHLRLVVSISRQYLGYGLPHADLIQEGNVGLMKAVRRFDERRGVRLVSFAVHWIRAEIHEYVVRNWRMVKIATTKAQRKLFFNLRSMKPGFGSLSEVETHEVARTLGVKPEEVREMEMRLSGGDVSLEGGQDENEDAVSPIAYLTQEGVEPSEILEQAEGSRNGLEGLHGALDSLDPRSRRIIEARWLGEEGAAMTLQELANEFKVSAERIRQIEQKALANLKRNLLPA